MGSLPGEDNPLEEGSLPGGDNPLEEGRLEEGSQLQSPGGGSPLEGGSQVELGSQSWFRTGEGSQSGVGAGEGSQSGLGPAGLGILQGIGVELPVLLNGDKMKVS